MDGKCGVRLVRGPAGDEPTRDESSLTEEPSIEVDTWAETFNQTVVKFTDRAKDLMEDSVTWNDRANFAIVGATTSQTLEMSWVTRQQLAWKIAAAHCKQNALPRLRATCRHQRMSLAPSRLSDVENSAYFKDVCQDNFEVLAEEIAERVATYQNSRPPCTAPAGQSPALIEASR